MNIEMHAEQRVLAFPKRLKSSALERARVSYALRGERNAMEVLGQWERDKVGEGRRGICLVFRPADE